MKQFVYIFFLILSAILLTNCDPNDGPVDPVDPNPPLPKKVEVTVKVNITYLSHLYQLTDMQIYFFKSGTFSYNKSFNVNQTAPPQVVHTFSFEGEEAAKLIGLEAKAMTSVKFRLGGYYWPTMQWESAPFIVKEGKNEVTINVVQPSSPSG